MRIQLSSFEQVIDEKILDRGLKYFKSGAVDDLEELETGRFEAQVRGTENYTVRLRISGNVITEFACTCPYDLGPVCKHVAAVIFHLKQDELGLKASKRKAAKPPAKRKTIADQVNAVLEKADRADIDRFIAAQCAEDRSFRNAFLAEFAQLGEGQSKAAYAKQLRGVLSGTDHWSMARPLSAVADKLLQRARKHITDGRQETALLIVTAVAEELVKALQSVDDSGGHMSHFIGEAFVLLNDIAGSSEELRKAVVDHCLTAHEKEVYEGWDWHITVLEIATAHARGDAEIKRLRALLEGDQLDGYEIERGIELTMRLLERTENPGAAEDFMNEHLHFPRLRKAAVAQAIARADFQRATKLTLEAIAQEEARNAPRALGSANYASSWIRQLLDIALAQGDRARIIEHARTLFLFSINRDREPFFTLLKSHVPVEQWPAFTDALIKEIKTRTRHYDHEHLALVLVREERWGELVRELAGTPHLARIEQYEKLLAKDHTAEVADLYIAAIRYDMTSAGGRGRYQQATRAIRRIIKLGQREKAEALISELREKYPQRMALLEELQKV